jgi:mannose/fructose/N-acetylgalactosamine-specific phosphotransferase system component IIC
VGTRIKRMDFNYTLISALTVIFFVIPIFFKYLKNKKDFRFDLKSITTLINYSLILQILLGVILYLLFLATGDKLVHIVFSRKIHTTFSIATVWFGVIGVFFYVPLAILLNIINFLVHRRKRTRKENIN